MSGSDAVAHWRTTLHRAEQLIRTHETIAARASLDALILFVNETWGTSDPHLIKPLRLIASSHFAEREPLDPRNDAQIACLRRALLIARSHVGDEHLEVAALTGEIGSALVIAGSFDEACALMTESLAIAARIGQSGSFTRYLDLIGHARMMQGRPRDALPFFERAVSAHDGDDSSPRTLAGKLYSLGICLRELERWKDALVVLERALLLARAHRVDPFFITSVKKEIAAIPADV